MREIKFRAWDKHYKVMVGVGGVKDLFSIRSDGKPSSQHYILMQFTGLLDKNGKEIYEGDIVKFLGYEVRLGKQIRPEHRFVVDGNDWIASLIRTSSVVECNGSAEVIGNLYENPELAARTFKEGK